MPFWTPRPTRESCRRVPALIAAGALLVACTQNDLVTPGERRTSADAASSQVWTAAQIASGQESPDARRAVGQTEPLVYGRGIGGLGGKKAKASGFHAPPIVPHTQHNLVHDAKYCYEPELAKNPKLSGRIEVQFTISAEGKVIAVVLVSSTMNNPKVERCLVNAIRRWRFPKPSGGGIVIVKYPFSFSPGTAE
jgi:TonB family protein